MSSIIPYGRQSINQSDIDAVTEALKSDFLTQGPRVKEFEDSFAKYVDAKYAVAVCNATAGLHLATLALGVSNGKSVITTPNTFVATSNSVLYSGGEVVFADIDPKTYCLDPNRVEDLLKKSPGKHVGIMPVDFAGLPSRMEDFKTLSEKYGVWIIEDGCHAPGATFTTRNGIQKVGNGNYADITSFSFHPVKHIACGEGGMLTTNDEKVYRKLMQLRTHGITKDRSEMTEYDGGWDYEMQVLGFNYRISDILCALGNSQLKRADESLDRRQKIADLYQKELSGLPLVLPHVESGSRHAYHLYVIRTEKRKELFDHLKMNDIYSQVHYIPVHQQPYYINRYGKQTFEQSENFYQECLSIPMYPTLTEEQQMRVIDSIKKFYG